MEKQLTFKKRISKAIKKAAKAIWNTTPYIIGTILLISLITTIIPPEFYAKVFTKNIFFDPFIGSSIGSVSAGSPVISYIISGELLKQGIALFAVTAFIISWVTVGIIQLPAESALLGKKFAIWRNITAFILAIIIAIIIWFIFK